MKHIKYSLFIAMVAFFMSTPTQVTSFSLIESAEKAAALVYDTVAEYAKELVDLLKPYSSKPENELLSSSKSFFQDTYKGVKKSGRNFCLDIGISEPTLLEQLSRKVDDLVIAFKKALNI